MKRLRLACGALALLIASLDLLSAQTAVRVLDYNIHRDIGASDSNISAQPALAKIVNYLNPDIWTINELGGNNVSFNSTNAHNFLVSFIQTKLTVFGPNPQENLNFFVYISTINDGFETVAIVSRYSLASTHTYSDSGGGFGSLRGLVTASVNVPGGTRLDVFTTHLKALSTTNDASERQAEANVDGVNIANWIASHPADAVIVTGDWNETEDTGEPCNWSGHQIGDILPGSGQAYRPVTTMHSAGLIDPSPASVAGVYDTISSSAPDARFDYAMFVRSSFLGGQIFATNQYTAAQLAALNSANGTAFVASDSSTASDHLPVLSILQVGGAPPRPSLFGVSQSGSNLSVTYQKVTSSSYAYAVESSPDLVNWTVATPQNEVLEQHGDIQTVKATVPTPAATRSFLRVSLTVSP
ncbi:MAG: endonuclease/exonuclease/phosphatase family protein [Verrucomicrobiota bacterium]